MNRIQKRNYTHNSEHQDASGISASIVYFFKYIKTRWLFGIWGCYFNLPFYDKETESQSSIFLKTFFLAELLSLTVHPSTFLYTFHEETNTSNIKRNRKDKQASEMFANKELFKKGHGACTWQPKISSLKKTKKAHPNPPCPD